MYTDGRIVEWPDKPPEARLDFGLDLTDWLAEAPGDTLASVTVASSTPDGLTIGDPDISQSPLVYLWISGGTHGTRYEVVFTVESTLERSDTFVGLLPVIDPSVEISDRVGPNQVG